MEHKSELDRDVLEAFIIILAECVPVDDWLYLCDRVESARGKPDALLKLARRLKDNPPILAGGDS